MEYFKKQSLHSRLIGDQSITLTADGEVLIEPTAGKVKIQGDLTVSGNTSGPEVTDVMYVTQDGSDTNDGNSRGPDGAKATIKSAVAGALPGTTIIVAAGDYYEDNPITLPDSITIKGEGELRNTRIFPKNQTKTIFYMGNACYLYQLTFRSLRYPGFCAEIRPNALVTTSPYVQNCTNMNGPWLNDGTEFIPFETVQLAGITPGARPLMLEDYPTLPTEKQINNTGGGGGIYVDGNSYNPASLVFSFVADAFTQIAQGGIGFWIDNFGYTQIVSCFSVFCSVGFKTTNGGYLSISNSVSDFGLQGLSSDGFYPQAYTTARAQQNYYSTVASVTINTAGANYTGNPTVVIEGPSLESGTQATATASIDPTNGKLSSVTIQQAGSGYTSVPLISFSGGGASAQATATVNLSTNITIRLNSLRDKPQTGSIIKFDSDPKYYYITGNNQINPPFIYDETICRRDLSRIIDAVTSDAVLGTSYQSQAAGTSYLRSTAGKVLTDQLAPTVYGIEQARDQMKANTTNISMEEEIDRLFNIITSTINEGDSSVQPDNSNDVANTFNDLQTLDPAKIAAKNNVFENREFLVEEVSAYINDQFTELSYNQDQYLKDMTLLINGIQMFAVLESNQQIIRSAQEYVIRARHKPMLISSFRYLSDKFEAEATVASSSIALANVKEGFNQFINIIDDGDSSANVIVFPNHAGVDLNRSDAKDQLIANRNFLLDEFVTFIQTGYPLFSFSESSYKADFGKILDAMTFDVLYGGNSSTVQEAKYYYGNVDFSVITPNNRIGLVSAYARMRFVIGRVVRGLAVTATTGNAFSQSFVSNNATQSEADFLDTLLFNIEDMISNLTLTRLPATLTYPIYENEPTLQINAANVINNKRDLFIADAISYNRLNNPTLTYDVDKCKRDVGYITDAIYRDILLGTNHNSITAGQAYKRANVAYLNVEQKPATILALKYAKTLGEAAVTNTTIKDAITARWEDVLNLIEFDQLPSEGTTFPDPGPATNELIFGVTQTQANRAFLIADLVAYINANNYVYNSDKCSRDTGLIIDAAAYDTLLGTNYNSVFAGLSYQRANSAYLQSNQKTQTIAGINFAKSRASDATTNSASQSVVEAAFDEVIDIINNGSESTEQAADVRVFANPTDATTGQINAKAQFQNNRTFLATEVVDFINDNYVNYSYNSATCERDVGLILDAVALDLALGTNYNSVTAGLAYSRAGALNNKQAQGVQTLASFKYLRKEALEKGLSDVGEARALAGFNEVIDIFSNGITSTDNSADGITFTTPTGANQDLVDAKNQLQANREFIAQETLAYVNANNPKYNVSTATYNQSTGDMVLTIGSHSYTTDDYIRLGKESLAFSCTYGQGAHTYVGGTVTNAITITAGAVQKDVTAATYNYATGILEMTIGSHSFTASDTVTIGANKLTFTCDADSNATNHTYPRATDPAAGNALAITAVTGTTISTNVGVISAAASSTKKYPRNNADPAYSSNLRITAVASNTITVNVGPNTTNPTVHTFESATPGAVTTGYNQDKCLRDARYLVDALSHDILYGGNSASRKVAQSYFEYGVSQLPNAQQRTAIVNAFTHIATNVIGDIIQEITVSPTRSKFTPTTGTTYAPATGQMKLVIGSHNLQLSELVKIEPSGVTFTCALDGNATNHAYPRATDPAIQRSFTPTTGTTYNPATGELVLAIGSHNLTTNMQVVIAPNSIVFTCTKDTTKPKTYPRRTDPAFQKGLDITAVTATTITMNVGVSSDVSTHTWVSSKTNCVTTGLLPIIALDATSITVDVGASSDVSTHTWVSSVTDSVSLGNFIVQDTSNGPASSSEAADLAGLVTNINSVITANSLSGLVALSAPSVSWASTALQADYNTIAAQKAGLATLVTAFITETFVGFNFNSTRCLRDTKYIVDALTYDVLYGGNSATVEVAKSYWVGTASQVDGQKAETAAALDFLSTILTNVLQDTALAYVWQSGVAQDISAGSATPTEVATAQNLLTVIKDVIENGLDNLPTITYPTYQTWVDTSVMDGISNLLSQKATIQSDTVDYINTTYNGYSYDQAACERDTGYLIDAITHDAYYTSNIATLIATRAYFLGAARYLPDSQVTQTVAAYTHLQSVVDDCIQGVAVTPQTGNSVSQVLSGNYGDSAVATQFKDLITITKTAINNKTLVGTPAEIEPNYSWIAQSTRDNCALFFAQKSSYQTKVITYLNENIIGFSYNIDKCKRDTGYIIDAAVYDMMYGGDKQTRRAALAYYNGAILGSISGSAYSDQSGVTAYANYYLADIIKKVASNEVVTTSFGNTATQALTIPDGSTLLDSSELPGTELSLLVDRVGRAIYDKSMGDWFEREHNHTLGNSIYNTERDAILLAESAIVNTAISNLNLTYGGIFDINVFPGVISVTTDKLASLNNVSTISTSGHAFEYVGAGITYNALPFFGGTADPTTEIIELNNGKIFAGGTVDQIGNFRVGNFFGVNALTGSITLNANEIDLSGLTSVGPFIRSGIPVGVELKEVSDNDALISSIGTQDFNTAPTQKAVANYVEARYLNKLTGGAIIGDVSLTGDVAINGGDLTTTATTFALANTDATTINAFGEATAINIGAATGTVTINPDVTIQGVLTVNGNLVFDGDVNISIPDQTLQAYSITEGTEDYISINTRQTEESITFGTQPKIIISNTTNSTSKDTGALVVDGGVGVESNMFVGGAFDADGNTTVGSDRTSNTHIIRGKVDIDIPDASINNFRIHENLSEYFNVITTDGSEQIKLGTTPKLIVENNTNATTSTTGAVQITGGLSTQQNLYSGNDVIADRDVIAKRDIEIQGNDITTTQTTFNAINTVATTVNAFGAATTLAIGGATGTLTLNNEIIIIDSVAGLQIPVGNTAQRPATVTGRIRFNTTTNAFEGYDGVAWNSLGGVIDVDQNTYIKAENSPGADNNELEFFTEGTRRINLTTSDMLVESSTTVTLNNTTESTNHETGSLTTLGGVGISKNLHVQGFISGAANGVLQLTDLGSDKILIAATTIETPDQLKVIANAPDSAADDIVYPISLAHHSVSGSPTVGSGTGLRFELETSNDNYEIGGQVDVVVRDITGNQEDFDMIFSTMINGSVVEKLKLGETTSTFTTDVSVNNDTLGTDQTTFNLLNTTATTINIGGAGTAINIGAAGGTSTFNQNVTVNETLQANVLTLTTDLAVQYGGTGRSTFVPNGIVFGDNANQLQVTEAAGSADINTSYQVLTVTDGGDDTPIWTDTLDGGSF
jgi:hypothetical protein